MTDTRSVTGRKQTATYIDNRNRFYFKFRAIQSSSTIFKESFGRPIGTGNVNDFILHICYRFRVTFLGWCSSVLL
jgi:hypothetical protein